jgi:DNA-binding NarL/FixJ family response regulator
MTTTEIVIAGNDLALAEALASVLSEGDRRVVAVASTAAALMATAGDRWPDLCVLDRWFGDRDALDLLAELHERSPSTKIVVITADRDRDAAQQALDRGAQAFVHKTRGASALLGAIDSVLAGGTAVELPPRWTVAAGGAPGRPRASDRTARP